MNCILRRAECTLPNKYGLQGTMDGIRMLRRNRSGEIARRRLKLLLVSDKANCSPEIMEMIKDDMIHVISKYMEIDDRYIEVGITKIDSNKESGTIPSLYANIPLLNLSYKENPIHIH